MTILVELERVSRQFRPEAPPALDSITASIRSGARIALMGRSGSGKSTLLNLIAGLDTPTAGRLTWPGLGEVTALLPTRIGIMFQSRSLLPWLDVGENVMLALQIAGDANSVPERTIELLRKFDLDHLAKKLPEELSGGQAQRVSLIRAMVTNPPLLLADEPTGQLDHATASSALDVLLEWATLQRAALVVASHDPAVAERMDMVWSLDHGTMKQAAR